MTRYRPARRFLWFGSSAVLLAVACAWVGWHYSRLAFVGSALFALSAAALLAVAQCPAIEVHEGFLRIGKRVIPWIDIRRVDRIGGVCPLLVRISLFDDSRMLLVHPGDAQSCPRLLRQLRRLSRDALIDGVPYRQYWGEIATAGERKHATPPPRFRVLRPEDEDEVERLYQRLKTVGNLDQKNSAEEK
jgi:hypothetical protein